MAGPTADLSVGGQVYQKGKLQPGVLHVDTNKGVIVKVVKAQKLKEHIEFGKKAILPGALDMHVHFRDPGHTHKEDLQSGSTAAAYGGVTAFVDMPNTLPPTTTLRALEEKLQACAQRAIVDYGVFAAGTWFVEDLPQMLKRALGVKVYLGATTGDLLLEELERLGPILEAASKANRPIIVHAEAQRVLEDLRRTEGTLLDHAQARPPMSEVEALYDVMKIAGTQKKPPTIHVAHCSSAEAHEVATQAGYSTGVTPHHLLLDIECGLSHAYGKVNPPLRDAKEQSALWALFAAGKVPILESDHAPHTRVEKEGVFHTAPAGLPGVETMVPVMLAAAKSKRVPLSRVIDAVTKNPADLLGLKQHGRLEAGAHADFAVYDLNKAGTVDSSKLHSKCGWSPYEGMRAFFPVHVYRRGKPLIHEGAVVESPGVGASLGG